MRDSLEKKIDQYLSLVFSFAFHTGSTFVDLEADPQGFDSSFIAGQSIYIGLGHGFLFGPVFGGPL